MSIILCFLDICAIEPDIFYCHNNTCIHIHLLYSMWCRDVSVPFLGRYPVRCGDWPLCFRLTVVGCHTYIVSVFGDDTGRITSIGLVVCSPAELFVRDALERKKKYPPHLVRGKRFSAHTTGAHPTVYMYIFRLVLRPKIDIPKSRKSAQVLSNGQYIYMYRIAYGRPATVPQPGDWWIHEATDRSRDGWIDWLIHGCSGGWMVVVVVVVRITTVNHVVE